MHRAHDNWTTVGTPTILVRASMSLSGKMYYISIAQLFELVVLSNVVQLF